MTHMCGDCMHNHYCISAYHKDHWCGNHVTHQQNNEFKRKIVMTKNHQVFKIQKSVFNNTHLVLIYNKNRTICTQMPISQELALFMEDKYKVYVEAEIDSDGILQIHREVENQKW